MNLICLVNLTNLKKYYPILTELNLNFIFSIESRNLNTNMNAYDLTTVKKNSFGFYKKYRI